MRERERERESDEFERGRERQQAAKKKKEKNDAKTYESFFPLAILAYARAPSSHVVAGNNL